MRFFRGVRWFVAGATIVCLAGCGKSDQVTLTYNSWVPASEIGNSVGSQPYFRRVEAETNGAVVFKSFFQGQLMGQVETLGAIRDAAVDSGFVIANVTPRDLPYSTMLSDTQGIDIDSLPAAAANNETILLDCPQCQEELKRNNVLALGGHATAPYYLMCSKALHTVDDLRGLRIRASLRFYADAAQTFGATPVNVSFPEMVPALQRGQVDCLIAIQYWIEAYKLADTVKSIVTTRTFGCLPTAGLIYINRRVWEGLSPEVRHAMIRNMPKAIADTTIALNEQAGPAMANALAAGVEAVDLGPEFARKMDAFRAAERERIVEVAESLGATDAEMLMQTYLANYAKWQKIVEKTGMDRDKFAQALWDEIYSKVDF
jgi:TRAP-type transport system periplasmic protein